MHCALAVPGLLSATADARLPALELLLGRGRCARFDSQPLESWLRDAFSEDDNAEPLAAGALTLLAYGGEPGDALWARADPVHLRVLRDRIVLVPGAAFSLSAEEAAALCEALNRHFAGRLVLQAPDPRHWCARLEQEVTVETASPLERAGRDIALGGPADALVNEVQMLLHEHPVNEAREARGELPANSLWFWGGGRRPRVARGRWHSIAADDPVALGLARAAWARGAALPDSAQVFLERAPQDGRHLVVLDALRAPLALGEVARYQEQLQALETRWFAPLLDALRARRAGMVTIHVPDAAGGVSFETIRADLRRFWRRARPLTSWREGN
jgi:hypothetical protein